MTTDTDNHYLVTGDVDGLIKAWDISEYCIRETDDVVTASPRKMLGLSANRM